MHDYLKTFKQLRFCYNLSLSFCPDTQVESLSRYPGRKFWPETRMTQLSIEQNHSYDLNINYKYVYYMTSLDSRERLWLECESLRDKNLIPLVLSLILATDSKPFSFHHFYDSNGNSNGNLRESIGTQKNLCISNKQKPQKRLWAFYNRLVALPGRW